MSESKNDKEKIAPVGTVKPVVRITGKLVEVRQDGKFIAKGVAVEYDRSLARYHVRCGHLWLGHYTRDELTVVT